MGFRFLAATIVACIATASAAAQGTGQTTFPGWAPSDAMVRIQEKAEAAFEAGKYRKAMWLYERELAPIGDKYAQYMIGYMHENGLSVARDPVQAGAWYLLAAERGHEQIVTAAEALQRSLGPAQLTTARSLAATLKEEMGDKTLVRRAIRRDIERLRSMAGTRIRQNNRRNCGLLSGRVLVGASSMSFDQYCEAVFDRLDARMAYLEGYVTYGELELLPDEDGAAESDDSASEE